MCVLPVVGDRACKPARLDLLKMKKQITCFLWISDAKCYAKVLFMTIANLRAKGVTVLETKSTSIPQSFTSGARFFEVQTAEVLA